MGKSPTTCFKILACGADSTEIDDDDPSSQSQNKQSSDRRKWGFRKKSARHQNITVISEPQSVDSNKDNSQAIPDAVKDSSVPQKSLLIEKENEAIASAVTYSETSPPVAKTDEVEVPLPSAGVNLEIPPVLEHLNEKTPLSSVEFSSELTGDVGTTKITTFNDVNQLNETTPFSSPLFYSEVTGKGIIKKITSTEDANIQEANMAIVIQSAVRRYLAQRKLRKLRDVVKLQAVVRGHLVRKQAIGTLRCVQAIVKLQTLVRARRARQCHLLDKITGKEKHDQTVKRNSDLKPNKTNSTVDKLLANGFARLLLESTANTKTIHITCDPLKNDSAWQWLERWMAVTSSTEGNLQELNCQDYQGAEKHNNTAYEELHVAPVSDAPSQLSDSKFSLGISTNTEGEEVSEMHNSVKFESEAPEIVSDQCLSFTTKGDREQSLNEEDLSSKEENTVTVKGKETSCITAPSAFDNKTNAADFVSAFGSVEAEGKKSDTGSKKVRNPAFAAVQAKFEELSSAPKSSSRSINFVGQDAAIESKPNHSMIDSVKKNNDLSFTENSSALAQNPMIQVAASECGTEISISSTLDSPDRSEPDGGEIVLEIGNSGKINQNMINDANNTFNLQTESRQHSTTSNELQGQRIKDNNENVSNANSPGDKIKVERQPAEATTPGISDQKENLQKTPRNHVTAPESHGTPSSQASSPAKPSKTQNSVPPQKPKLTKSVSKSSPSNGKNDSGDRSSTEQHLPKDAKNAKRRSSFGMAKPDHVDNEPRRSSSNSLPSYMQATESARAKAHGSISLKSSPDVHDKENHTTKRHSFPIEDEKQGSSPRVQRSTSQTQQSLKGNSTHSPHNSAERRWQR